MCYQYIISLCLLFSLQSIAQSNHSSADTTIQINVFGNCEMCKERIEEAAKGRGVKSAVWDATTKILSLSYDPSKTTSEKVQQRIADVGHDTELKKAKDNVYNELPECCLYRHGTMEQLLDKANKQAIADTSTVSAVGVNSVKGVVLEADTKGNFRPLRGASIIWLGTSSGTIADSTGVFRLPATEKSNRLVVSYAGYGSDTINVVPTTELKIILATNNQLSEVTLTSKQRSTYLSSLNPIRTQVMTEKELFKAACCNLSESFETNPAVDVSFNDAVTGSKQIQLLGLSGNYTQLTVENLPGPRGIATPLGLNFIAGPWVESIQLSKGVGSVANGYESIAGQINIELKKPEKAERLYANLYLNDMGKSDLNLNLTQKIGKKWNVALMLHDDFINNKKVDFNKDGFRDLPTGNQFSAINRWMYTNEKGFITQFGFKLLMDNRTGGETAFNPATDKGTTAHYGLGIETKRYEGFAKIGYVFPTKKYKSFGLQLSGYSHQQESYFGLTNYTAKQKNFYANLIYQSIIASTKHKFRTGLSVTADDINEQFTNQAYQRVEKVPGAFFEYTFDPVAKFSVVAGIRADHNNLYGWFATPRLHIRYEPIPGTTIRLSAGRGQRTANIFAENMSVLVSARQVQILTTSMDKAYGLDAETAWNKGISIDQKMKLFHKNALLSIDFFRNDFMNQLVTDLEDVRFVKFYNLNGKSFSNSFQAQLNLEPVRKVELRLAYRLFDVKATYGTALLQKPLTAKHRAFANLAYETGSWKFDYTINYNGTKRIPSTNGNSVQYQLPTRSPSFVLMNAQVSKTIGEIHPFDVYLGGENLTNYFQQKVIIAADQPFSNFFDASMVWGPVSGRLIYIGLRYKIK